MYYVLRQMRPFDSSAQTAWEEEFCEAIAAYMREIVAVAAPTVGVYVSCDGVVCAAKRRQQRLRRFKGPWISASEQEVKRLTAAAAAASGEESATTESWDQNALTPGSAFMARLGAHLTAAGAALATKTGLEVVISTTAEPGEGEHKLLAHMRRVRPVSCTIYGLDADLILLAMLLTVDTGGAVNLLREAQEFEGRGPTAGGASSSWRTLDIGALIGVLGLSVLKGQVRDFVAAMTLLGNDFLSRSLTRTVRDDGIPQLLATLRSLWASGRTFVDDRGAIRREALLEIVGTWAATEEADMLNAVKDARRAATSPVIGSTPVETALKEWNALPARWCSVGRLLGSNEANALVPRWRDVYRGSWRAGSPEAYVAGVAWTWDYYSGRSVCQGWSFDEHLPPLWSDVSAYLKELSVDRIAAPAIAWPTSLPEWIHLLSVLPVASVDRLLPLAQRRLMKEQPWYWPASWSLFDIGRGLMWECEAVIPQIPESVLRSISL
jgi:5'-3' exonuclease